MYSASPLGRTAPTWTILRLTMAAEDFPGFARSSLVWLYLLERSSVLLAGIAVRVPP